MPGGQGDKEASDALKMAAAEDVGIADRVRREGWGDVTTKEVGLVVRSMIKRGEEALIDKARRSDNAGKNN